MVEKYTTSKIYETIAFGGEASLPVEFVSITDYAALEAERDELKRRCEAMWTWLYHNDFVAYTALSDFMHEKGRQEHAESNQMNTDFAEGRDNG